MEPKRVDPMTGVLNFMMAMALDNPSPYQQITTKLEGITVDTSLPKDTNTWETGIERLNIEGKWVIVEQYPDEEAAKVGQEKWVKMMTEYPDYPLKDIDIWSLDIEEEQ